MSLLALSWLPESRGDLYQLAHLVLLRKYRGVRWFVTIVPLDRAKVCQPRCFWVMTWNLMA